MCGIAGYVSDGVDLEVVDRMARSLAHRGPDDQGVWVDKDAGIALGHRRLAIIDLSAAGHQPMASPSGRFMISYNGEVYNFSELRAELGEVDWQGHSDTEVLLAGFEAWGIKRTLEKASGMFALAVWDRNERALSLARDRLGEKPLYYGWQGNSFLFGSELKALREHPAFEGEIDREAIALLTRYLAIPAPRSIYRGIAKLMPGTLLTLRGAARDPTIDTYWSGAAVALTGNADPLKLDPGAATDALEQVLDRAVGRQMVADVPLGAFLSGGIDSSTIVAIMQKLSPRPVKTFTVGFQDRDFNEAEHAKAVAQHLGTDHTELYVSPQQALDVIPQLSAIYDEPFADSSQIPTHLISRIARAEVTVALSGDGGDELFGGYERYLFTANMWDRISKVPRALRTLGARGLAAVPADRWGQVGNLLPRSLRRARFGEKVHKGAAVLASRSPDELYEQMLSLWRDPAEFVIGAPPNMPPSGLDPRELGDLRPVERMMTQDMLGYLANDILVKVDRAAMAVSLETRVPLLDPEVVEFAWRLPLDLKIRGRTTKWLLREVLYRHVPRTLIDRPKMGFGIPLDSWLRGPLRDWAEDLLDERRLREQGFFRPEPVRKAWAAQQRGESTAFKLWPTLIFQSWLDSQTERAPLPSTRAEPKPA